MLSVKKITEYLWYVFVFLLPWQTRWIFFDPKINGQVWEYGRMSLYAFDIVFVILLASYGLVGLFNKIKNSKLEIRNKIQIQNLKLKNRKIFFIVLGIIFIILNIIFSQDKILAVYWWLRIGEVLGFFWVLWNGKFSKIKIACTFIISMIISTGLGIYQFLTQSVFASKWLGIASQKAVDLGVSVVAVGEERWIRAYGSLPHPNILAGFIVVAIILCWWLVTKKHENINRNNITTPIRYNIGSPLLVPLRGIRPSAEKKKENSGWGLVGGCLLLTIGLFMTFSRASWLMLMILLIVLIIHYIYDIKLKTQNSKLQNKNSWFVFLCIFIFLALSFIYWPLVKTRLGSGEARLETKSNQERVSGYQESWQIIKNSPLIGVGAGNYTAALQKLQPGLKAWNYQPVHNVYLLIWSELGVLGFLGVLGMLGILWWEIRKTWGAVFIISLLFLFLFDHFWWTLPSGLLVWALVIGMVKNEL